MQKKICLACARNNVQDPGFAVAVAELEEILQSEDCGYEVLPGSSFVLEPDLLLVILDHAEADKEVPGALYLARQKKTISILAVASADTMVPESLAKQCDEIRRYANLPRDVSQMVCAKISSMQIAA